jgi:2-amino-4-hydroxy-6-hydroxymethyldihydropteridine diphosphokinase
VIIIGIGSNLAASPNTTPRETAERAVDALPGVGVRIAARSGWYLSEPVPASDQPWFVNGVAIVTCDLAPQALLDRLLAIESEFGRVRGEPNADRTVDLDLLDYDGCLCDTPTLTLPHPRMHQRRFVLEPLFEICPTWRHPGSGLTVIELVDRLPPGQAIRRFDEAD